MTSDGHRPPWSLVAGHSQRRGHRSTSRRGACLAFVPSGEYPLRTNILNVVTGFTLANSQVSPFETTTPKLLKELGYDSAPFGKSHLAGHAGARRRRRLAFCRRVVIEAYRRTPSGERYG